MIVGQTSLNLGIVYSGSLNTGPQALRGNVAGRSVCFPHTKVKDHHSEPNSDSSVGTYTGGTLSENVKRNQPEMVEMRRPGSGCTAGCTRLFSQLRVHQRNKVQISIGLEDHWSPIHTAMAEPSMLL